MKLYPTFIVIFDEVIDAFTYNFDNGIVTTLMLACYFLFSSSVILVYIEFVV